MDKIKSILPYLFGLLAIACIVFFPELQGKKLNVPDNVSVHEASKETIDYREKGEDIFWTSRVFSGMPTFLIAGDVANNYIVDSVFFLTKFIGNNIVYLIIVFLSCFLSLILVGVRVPIAFILAIAFGLNTWVLDSLWASHPTKILSYALGMLTLSGFMRYMKDQSLFGLVAIGIGVSLLIGFGHYQIVYYFAIVCAIMGLYFFIEAFKGSELASFFKKIAFVFVFVIIGVLTNISSLYIVNDYNKETMRGGKTELTKKEATSTSKTGGLDINYAFLWSYSVPELLNFIVPDAVGGSSNYSIKTEKSQLAKAVNPNEDENVLPFYWGIQPFTGAPNYLGVGVFFLFIFSLFYWQNRIKYVFLGIFVMSLFMGLGRSFLPFNELLFDFLPLYNKFRTPTMSFSILNAITILTIGGALHSFLNSYEEDKTRTWKSLKYASICFIGLMLIGYVLVSNGGYTGENDAKVFGNNQEALKLAMEDRASMMKSDWIRSLFIFFIIAGLIYTLIKNTISQKVFLIGLGAVLFFDLYTVHKRYLTVDAFQKAANVDELVPNESYNQYLEQDKSHFRVFNFANPNIFNDNVDGYRFSNVGGYSPAKLYRYQDLIDMYLSKGNIPVLNMLNTKYFIVDNQGQKMPQINPDAAGNAWFVREIRFAKDANEEMDSIGTFNPKQTVWIDKRYENSGVEFKTNSDTTARIELTKYHPDHMEYTSNTRTGGFAVFSEIWYKGNEDWKLYIDGKPSTMLRVNYLLRGAYLPAGKHKLEMIFKPAKLSILLVISAIASISLIAMLMFFFYQTYKKSREEIQKI